MAGPFRKTRHALAYLIVKLFFLQALIMPRWLALPLFSLAGRLIGLILLPYRREIMGNLDFVFRNEKTKREKMKICSAIFSNLGKTLYDAIKLPSMPEEKFNRIVEADTSSVQSALTSPGKGIIALSGHFSCFELQAQIYARHSVPVVAIGAPLFDKRIDRLVENLRKRNGVTYMHRDGVGRKLIKELKNNKLFGALIDQDATSDGVFAHFLGNLAFTPTGPIRLAQKFGIPLFFQVLERTPENKYKLHLEGPIVSPNTGDDVQDLVVLAEKFNSYFSEYVKRCPEQWVWMHRRWKRNRDDFPDTPSITDYQEQ